MHCVYRTLYYKLIEECVGQIVLNRNGMDPDFRYRRLFNLDVESLLARMAEIYGPGADTSSHAGSEPSLDGLSSGGPPSSSGVSSAGGPGTGPSPASHGAGAAKLFGSRSELHRRLDEALTEKNEHEAKIAMLEGKLQHRDSLVKELQDKVRLV